jgi:hypothetical protein
MITLDSPDVLGHCTFCDEIRTEINGKLFFIGVYPGAMRVSGDFPFILPRLGVAITYMQRPEIFLAPKFVVFLPGDKDKPSIEVELPEEAVKSSLENVKELQAKYIDPRNAFASIHANFNFGNLSIPKPGLLKVRVARGQELFRLGTIMIESASARPSHPAT